MQGLKMRIPPAAPAHRSLEALRTRAITPAAKPLSRSVFWRCQAQKGDELPGDDASDDAAGAQSPGISYVDNEATKAAAMAETTDENVVVSVPTPGWVNHLTHAEASAMSDEESTIAAGASATSDETPAIAYVADAVAYGASAIADEATAVAYEAPAIADVALAVAGGSSAVADEASAVADMRPAVSTGASAMAEEASAFIGSDAMSLEELKAALIDSLYMTDRGLSPSFEARAEIHELLSQLEANCPTPNPTENLEKLSGTWKLVYTSNSPLLGVLALGRLPLVTVGDITQTISADTLTAESKVELSSPFSRTALTASASFEVRSPKRLQLQLEKGVLRTPELLTDIEIPDSLSLLGTPLDLSQLKSALGPANEGLMGFFSQVNDVLAQTPEIAVPLASAGVQAWQLNTYVDEDTRIARGDGGSIFLYVKEPKEGPAPKWEAPVVDPVVVDA